MKKILIIVSILLLLAGCSLPGIPNGKVEFSIDNNEQALNSWTGKIFHMFGHQMTSHRVEIEFSEDKNPYNLDSILYSISIDISEELTNYEIPDTLSKPFPNKEYPCLLSYGKVHSSNGIYYSANCTAKINSNMGSYGYISGTIEKAILINKDNKSDTIELKNINFKSYIYEDRSAIE